MEKILIALLFIGLNTGLYLIFVLDEQLRIDKRVKILFFVSLAVVGIFAIVSDSQSLGLIRMSIVLLLLYLIGLGLYKFFFLRYFEQKKMEFPKLIKKIVLFGILPIYTLFVTASQILLVFKII
jgi:hypothetical protein